MRLSLSFGQTINIKKAITEGESEWILPPNI